MNTKRLPRLWIKLCGLVVVASLMLVSCAILPLASSETTEHVITESGYPGPTPSDGPATLPPLPTQADGSPNDLYSYFATPSPSERVGVDNVVEVSTTLPTPNYDFENTLVGSDVNRIMVLYVTNPRTGKAARLGDDSGSAVMGTINDNYVVWVFLCDPCQDMRAGIYVHSFANAKDTWIDDQAIATQGSIKIAGQWITYMKPSESPSRYAARLYAYNLQTGENLLIAENAIYMVAGTAGYNAVNEDMVAWVADGPTVNDWTLHVYDLTTQTTRQIEVELKDPRYLSISRNIVAWWDVFWKGYDLAQDALFTIPVVPPGWDVASIKSVGPVEARGRQLFWTLEVNGQTHRFTAPLVDRVSTPQPASTTPTATAVPTTYP